MSNSPLVTYKRISPNQYGKRNHVLDTITIHCMAGQLTVEQCGAIFASSSRQASSNYGVGKDGRIGMYVEENCASWCTSNYANDQRAVTIEVASDSSGAYKVNDKAYKSLINLVYDICKRNGIKKLKWSTKKKNRMEHKNGCNMTVHRDYADKACPGDYLYGKMGDIAKKVNAKLKSAEKIRPGTTITTKKECNLYSKSFKDPVGRASTYSTIHKGTKVKLVKDLGNGWSKISYKSKQYYVINANLSSKLSTYKKVTLTKEHKCRAVTKDNKLSNAVTLLKKGAKVSVICKIKSGEFKDFSYIDYKKKKYYVKNL